MVVSPDVGGVVRARALAKRIDAPLAIVDKRRERPGESEVMNIIGDVKGKCCILVDDIVDSGGTLCNAADALLEKGARSRVWPISPTACCRAGRWRASAHRAQGAGDHRFDPGHRGDPGVAQHPGPHHLVLIGEAIGAPPRKNRSRACSTDKP
jgi:hypothetical protein